MPTSNMSRSAYLFGDVALAGCQTTGMNPNTDKILTNAYDGDCNIAIGRIWNPTPNNLRDKYYREEPETLAFLKVRILKGHSSVI